MYKQQAIVIATCLLVAPTLQAGTDIDNLTQKMNFLKQQLQSLQQQLDQLQSSQQSMKNQNTELNAEVSVLQELQHEAETSAEDDDINVNMYVTLAVENFAGSDSTFDARNVELLVNGRLTDRLHAAAEIEFKRAAKTSGGNRAGEVEVEQGWMQYDISKALNLRAGVILVPFGKFNLEHFDVVRDLTDRPIAMRRVIPVAWAEAGFGSVGHFSLDAGTTINYQAFIINGLTDKIFDRGLRSARGAFGADNNNNKAIVSRVDYQTDRSELGISVYRGDYDSNDGSITGVDFDWQFEWDNLQLLGEYVRFDLDDGVNSDGIAVPAQMEGGYLQLNYHFWPDALAGSFLSRNFANPTFTAIFRYGWSDNSDDGDVGIGNNQEQRWTLGFNYRPVESYVFKCEYQWNHTRVEKLERGNSDGMICSVSAAF